MAASCEHDSRDLDFVASVRAGWFMPKAEKWNREKAHVRFCDLPSTERTYCGDTENQECSAILRKALACASLRLCVPES